MEVKNKIETCSYCGRKCELNYGVENFNSTDLSLTNYKNYKDIYVYTCSKCGQISTDISGNDAQFYELVKNSEEFNSAINYSYLEGLNNQLFENESETVPANTYDGYAIMLSKSPDKEKYLRALNKSIELKALMLDKYELNLEEDYDEEDEKILDELEDLAYENIDEARELFINEVSKLKTDNIFLLLMSIENLVGLENYKEAKIQYSILKENLKNINVSKDLIDYFDKLVERG